MNYQRKVAVINVKLVISPIKDDILSVVRVRKLDPESNNPRAVVVKLRSMLQRDTILTSVMKYNKAHPDKKLNSQLLGLAAQLNNYDVIIGTETWLDDSVNDGELFDSRYIIYRRDRASTLLGSKKGGGVLIAVSRAMDSTRVSKWESDAEDLWVKLKTEGRKGNVYICAAYLPPPVQQAPLNSILDNVDAVIEATGGDVIIAGDFNLGFIDWSTDNSLSSPPSTTARNFANRTYVNNTEDNIRLNPKAFWSFVKAKKAKSNDIPSEMYCDGKVATSGEEYRLTPDPRESPHHARERCARAGPRAPRADPPPPSRRSECRRSSLSSLQRT
ncbi:hypothetical protein PYW07_001105 [Mythimna separata]|uniref:Endonuclease/exonuclease/phosphatase domain-containing protein n=1 Tax=Mythimna separata TaxID=271217 RepID=A0AAD7YRN9_MYTSE|nr:hypothetical protein PYW07_001105 [Mythimna separata]